MLGGRQNGRGEEERKSGVVRREVGELQLIFTSQGLIWERSNRFVTAGIDDTVIEHYPRSFRFSIKSYLEQVL